MYKRWYPLREQVFYLKAVKKVQSLYKIGFPWKEREYEHRVYLSANEDGTYTLL